MLVVVHLILTAFMTGLIWLVQLVHYPGFALVPADAFVEYEARHVRRISWIVFPVMLAELATALALPFLLDDPSTIALAWLGALLLGAIWLSTIFLQMPCHRALEQAFDAAVVSRLVRTNWIRTTAWTGRTVILATILLTSG